MPNVGYQVPSDIRGLHPSGLIDTLIFSIEDLEALNPEIHGVRISARIGAKKRIKIVEAAFEKKFRILNTSLKVEKEEDEETKEEATEKEEEVSEEELSLKQKHIKEIKEKSKQKAEAEKNSPAQQGEVEP
mgnify:CR=1 FL=1